MSNKPKINLSFDNVATCALYAVIGILLVILRGGSLNILMTVIGVIFIALGIIDVVKSKDVVKGIVECAIGVVIIVCGWLIADIVLLVFGILLVIKGGIDLYNNVKSGFMAMLAPIVTIIIGILLIIAKWTLLDVFCIIVGVVFIANAVLTLFDQSLTK